MKIPKVNFCCCGCTLYGGTMIIAVYETFSLLIRMINILIGSQGTESVFTEAVKTMRATKMSTLANATEIDDTLAVLRPLFHFIDGIIVVHVIIAIALSLLLIYGTIKRSPAHILPWLMTEAVVNVSVTITYIGVAIFIMTRTYVLFVGLVVLTIFLLGVALKCYCLVVVYSFYLETKSPPQYGDSLQVNYKV